MRVQLSWSLSIFILAACNHAPSAATPRAREDAVALLGAVSVATAYAYGEVDRVVRIDRTGYRARFVVRQPVAGILQPGQQLNITWEELAQNRAARFARGDKILVALAPLPETTLWLHRVPPQLRKENIFIVAAGGDAFIRNPDPEKLDVVSRYTRLTGSNRAGPEGARSLSAIVSGGEDRLALAAIHILGQSATADAFDDPEVAQALGTVLDRREPAAVVKSVLSLAEEHRLHMLREPVLRLAKAGIPLSRLAWKVLVAWGDAAVSPELVRSWSEDAEAEWRALAALAAKWRRDAEILDRLAHDDDPRVRTQVAEASGESKDTAHLARLLRLLGDPDDGVRRAASTALARSGPAVLPSLEAVLFGSDTVRAPAAVLALAQLGNEGRELLQRAAQQHPDERVRSLAALALGKLSGEH